MLFKDLHVVVCCSQFVQIDIVIQLVGVEIFGVEFAVSVVAVGIVPAAMRCGLRQLQRALRRIADEYMKRAANVRIQLVTDQVLDNGP